MIKKAQKSKTLVKAGASAEIITISSIILSYFIISFILKAPKTNVPAVFTALLVLLGVFMVFLIWATSYSWLLRLRGGSAALNLAYDPVPHGVPVPVNFEISKTFPSEQWRVEVALKKNRGEDVPDTLWKQSFPIHHLDDRHGKTEIMLPSNIFSTADSRRYKVTLMLVADKIVWVFDLKTFHPKNLVTPA